jgi:hypothetical protein
VSPDVFGVDEPLDDPDAALGVPDDAAFPPPLLLHAVMIKTIVIADPAVRSLLRSGTVTLPQGMSTIAKLFNPGAGFARTYNNPRK